MQNRHFTQPDTEATDSTCCAGDAQWVSGMVDGELSPQEFSVAWAQLQTSESAAQAWHTQHLIGDVLRRQIGGRSAGLAADQSQAFANQVVVLAKMRSDEPVSVVPNAEAHLMGAPSQGAVLAGVSPKPQIAANDSVFRWKAVAGLASLSAVLSVAWNVWWASGSAMLPSLAQAPVEQSVPTVPVAPADAAASATVLVATDRGVIERDARLDALIQAHRQHGGGTAWQVPAGFMRAATHNSPSN